MARQSSPEDALFDTVFEPVFRRIADKYPHTGGFSVAATCEACEAAMAAYLGEPVDTLREGLRPASARGGPDEPPANRTEATATPPTAEAVAHTAHAESPPPERDDLLRRARAFAEVAGLGGCVQDSHLKVRRSIKEYPGALHTQSGKYPSDKSHLRYQVPLN